MRLPKGFWITLPLSALIAGLGGILFLKVNSERRPGEFPSRHPVSEDLRKKESAKLMQVAPEISGTDAFGDKIQLTEFRNGKPAVVLFILHDCPCSIEAQETFNTLYITNQRYVTFVGVVKGTQKEARRFFNETSCAFPVVADETGAWAKAYGVKRSVYNALITPDGKIAKIFPGYSKTVANQIGEWCAKYATERVAPMTFDSAPKIETAGCEFFPE
ncbi:MAG: redoxin domain-containing protein [Chthonomonas sp.]|nr:redoxin domain-containing protein [Chthonomonas sp.]